MEIIQSFEIEDTPKSKISIATTGISKIEISALSLPVNYVLSPTLTPKTRFLVTYKAIFTEKYVQALHWNIPILNSNFLYDITGNYKKYQMKPFQGALFTTSGIDDEIYSNYFTLLGAKYESNCTIFIDFIICDQIDTEKYKFCLKYGIPVIKTDDVFKNDYSLFMKKIKYDAKQINPKALFFDKTFYLDQNLPKTVFNRLRRVIIENEGTRVSSLSSAVNYIITMDVEPYYKKEDLIDYSNRLLHYQYVFDCKESGSFLYSESYKYFYCEAPIILKDTICVVDKILSKEYILKLRALGGTVKNNLDRRVTYYISNNCDSKIIKEFGNRDIISKIPGSEYPLPFKVVSTDWVDQCLIIMKHAKEGRHLSYKVFTKKIKDDASGTPELFQFTCLLTFFREEAVLKFRQYDIKHSNSDKFEECTHLIMGVVNSSQKFLCSLVSGCWILRPDFIQAFENQPNFEYERYEWVSTESMNEKDRKSSDSCRKWRKIIQGGGKKPFYKWNVKIYSTEEKALKI